MKKFISVFSLVVVLVLLVVGPALAGELAEKTQGIFIDFIAGFMGLLMTLITYFAGKWVSKATTKMGIELDQGIIDNAADHAVNYTEEWFRKYAKVGVVKSGAEKFERAVNKMIEISPIPLPRTLIESSIVAALNKARNMGLQAAGDYVDVKIGGTD